MSLATQMRRAAAGVSTGSSWTPADLTDLLYWFDADDSGTITESSGSVSQWDDKSGNDYHATQGTGSAQPTTGTRTVNSKNVLDFDGGDNLAFTPSFWSDNTLTVVVVCAKDAVANKSIVLGVTNLGSRYLLVGSDSASSAPVARFGSAVETATASLPVSTPAAVFTRRNASGLVTVGFDFANESSGSTDTAGNSFNNIGYYTSSSFFFDGVVAEIIGVDAYVSGSDWTSLETYLNDKWAL